MIRPFARERRGLCEQAVSQRGAKRRVNAESLFDIGIEVAMAIFDDRDGRIQVVRVNAEGDLHYGFAGSTACDLLHRLGNHRHARGQTFGVIGEQVVLDERRRYDG